MFMRFAVACERGTSKFSGIATSRKPKLYVVSVDEKPIYVGLTKQPIRNRLRLGMEREGRDRLLRLRLAAPPRECIPGRVGSRRPSDRERMP
jgi:hypothetical protein